MSSYLDNAATTRCFPEAAKLAAKVMTEEYGNPSSLHGKGIEAEQHLRHTRRSVAKSLKARENEIYFTSGGTEGNNTAIFGTVRARKRRGRHIITTMVEHPSVYNAFSALEEEGCEVTYLPTDGKGLISLEQLESALREDTILVSIMHVNNEVGTIQPIEEAAHIIHQHSPEALFHVDAVQSYGKLPIYPGRIGVDLMSVSGHKLHAPKGSGFLYIREKARILPLMYGGGQERSMRSGTENVPAIAGLGVAVDKVFSDNFLHSQNMYRLKQQLADGVSDIEGVSIHSNLDETFAPHILSISIEGVKSEVMLHALEERGVYVSSGSACSSNHPSASRTLLAMGVNREQMDTAIRFSLSMNTDESDITAACNALKDLVPVLRNFQRR